MGLGATRDVPVGSASGNLVPLVEDEKAYRQAIDHPAPTIRKDELRAVAQRAVWSGRGCGQPRSFILARGVSMDKWPSRGGLLGMLLCRDACGRAHNGGGMVSAQASHDNGHGRWHRRSGSSANASPAGGGSAARRRRRDGRMREWWIGAHRGWSFISSDVGARVFWGRRFSGAGSEPRRRRCPASMPPP